MRYEEIPYASEQGIFGRINRELKRGITEFATLIRESRFWGRQGICRVNIRLKRLHLRGLLAVGTRTRA